MRSSLRFAVAAAIMVATALLLQARSRNEVLPPREPLSALPMQFGHWVGKDFTIDQQTLDVLGPGEFVSRDFIAPGQSQPPIELFIAYFASQKASETLHSPNHCLPGAGWVPIKRELVHLPRSDGSSFPANRYVVSKAGERRLVIYWYQAHDRIVANEYWSKFYLVTDSIRMNRSDGAMIRLMTPMFERESADSAQTRVMSLGSQLIPVLNTYIPR